MAYKIDPEICIGCDACLYTCPTRSVLKDDSTGKNKIDSDYCVSCGLCASFCEKGAIISDNALPAEFKRWTKWTMPFIDPERCTGCSLCIEECPMNAIALSRAEYRGDIHTHAYLKDATLCIGCEKCSARCPIGAIIPIPQLDDTGAERPENVWPEDIERPNGKKHRISRSEKS